MRVHSSCSTCQCVKPPTWREFEYYYRDSYKFWNIKRDGVKVWTKYGRIGTTGSMLLKEFDYSWEASAYVTKMVNEKLNKGYIEIS